MSLQRSGDLSTIPEHAVIALPKSYEDAVAAAYEVFNLGSKSIDKNEIQLRRSVQHIGSKTNVWANILPREWTEVVRSNIDEVAVFMKEDEDESMRDGAGEKVLDGSGEHPRLLHLIGVNRESERDADRCFVVPMPESYEECRTIAHGLMVWFARVKPTDLILKGIFDVRGNTASRILVRSAYPSYINRPGSPEIHVYNW